MKEKNKIAICTSGFKPVPAVRGGAVEQLTTYLIQMNEKYGDYKLDVITVQDSILDTISFRNTEIIQVVDKQNRPLYKFLYRIINKLYRILHLERRVTYIEKQIAKECIRRGYQKVLVENDMPIYIEIKRKLPNTELIFHLHNNIDCKDPCKTAKQTKYISKTASIVIVVSDFIKKRFENVVGVSKIEILYNCIDRQLFNPKRFSDREIQKQKDKLKLKKEDVIIMFLGRLDSQKGIMELIDALLLLEKTESFACLIIGSNFFGSKEESNYFNKIQEKIRNDNRFISLGMLNYKDVPLMYAIADIVVIPSQCEEAFGMVALEAASMKKAVIASYIGGIPDILSKESALYISIGKDYIYDLSKALKLLINNKIIREKLGQNGYEYTRKKFGDVEDYYLRFKKIISNTFGIGE